jgi:glycosyltransferase involved in cell wall biosynthesis
VASIIAGTTYPYKLWVIDDCSKDGTKEWLVEQRSAKKVDAIILNKSNIGTVKCFNKIISTAPGNWVVFANDDMWFHRYWDWACMDIAITFDDCGAISFYNYTNNKVMKAIRAGVNKAVSTGLGATMIYRNTWDKMGGFNLGGKLMGFFASKFCIGMSRLRIKRKIIYCPVPHYATNMDMASTKLNETKYSLEIGYLPHRWHHKRGLSKKKIEELKKEVAKRGINEN